MSCMGEPQSKIVHHHPHHAKIVTERGKFQKIMSEMKTIQMRRKEEVKWKQHSIKNVLE